MYHSIQNGDILIIGGKSYIVVDYIGTDNPKERIYKHALLCLNTFTQKCRLKNVNLQIGDNIFQEDDSDLKLERIIPKEKVYIYWKLFG